MMRRIFALAAVAFAPALYSQSAPPTAAIPAAELSALLKRSVQLIESTSAAVPGLVRAAAPVQESTRQALANIDAAPPGHPGLLYNFLLDLRSYLALADSVPKPSPFPDEARRQFAELRDSVDRLQAHFRVTLDRLAIQARNPDRDNLLRYAEANAKLAKPAAGQKRVVFFGDSITDLWRLNEYFPGRDFVNRGIGGQVTGEMLGRMKADVIDLQPAAVLILAGTNDIARGTPLSTIETNLVMIADLAETYRIKPIFASVLPVSDYHKDVNPRNEMTRTHPPATILELNRWIEAFCKQRHYQYVDYFAPLADPSGQIKTDLADDGLHPNAAGYRIMAPVGMDALERTVLTPPPPVLVSTKRAPKPKPEAKPEVKLEAKREAKPEVKPQAKPEVKAEAKPEAKAEVKAEKPKATPAAKPSTDLSAATTAPPTTPKQKKEPFWKRTYPSTPPKQ